MTCSLPELVRLKLRLHAAKVVGLLRIEAASLVRVQIETPHGFKPVVSLIQEVFNEQATEGAVRRLRSSIDAGRFPDEQNRLAL